LAPSIHCQAADTSGCSDFLYPAERNVETNSRLVLDWQFTHNSDGEETRRNDRLEKAKEESEGEEGAIVKD
jgi:uncharacterized GH25 family protein